MSHSLATWLLVLLGAAAVVVAAAPSPVTFRADDGRSITATLYQANRQPAPAVVLVPMLGRSRDDWQGLGQTLADANITALAIDLPGQVTPADPKALAAWSADVRAAIGYLAILPAVRASAIGVAGASLGSTLAALEAAPDPRVKALVLVSPSLEYRGVRIEAAMKEYGGRPALLLASAHDPYAARSTRELSKDAPGPREVHWSEAPAHGTVLLGREPDLARVIVEWFQRTLTVN